MREKGRKKSTVRWPDESGQTTVLVVLVFGLFLLGAVGFGVDITNLWFHRQAAQSAADAACTAGAMDLLYQANSIPAPLASSGSWAWIGQNGVNCGGHYAGGSAYAPCWYAAQNGYNGTGLITGSPSTEVVIDAPTSVAGVTPCSSSYTGSGCLPGWVANPLLQVTVKDRVQVFFAGMISGAHTMDVGAQATCGVLAVQSPVPLLVLNPTLPSTATSNGNYAISIYGGPQKSIQVNSTNIGAWGIAGVAGGINLSQGGPSATGSDLAITGLQPYSTVSASVSLGTTGHYFAPTSPISDPFAQVCAPGQSSDCLSSINGFSAPSAVSSPVWNATKGDGTTVTGPAGGCPSGLTCTHYLAGYYPNGIEVKNTAAVFDPGLYYIRNGMALDANSQACPGTGPGEGTGGTIFYFADASSISVAANSGSSGAICTNSSGTNLTANDVRCTGSSTLPANLPASTVLAGNILLAPCSGYYGDPLGTSDPSGEQRGMLFFQNRSFSALPQWGGGGAFTLAGAMYFHYCDGSTAGSGVRCDPINGYTTQLELGGGSCSGTYILGDIIVDMLYLHGNPCLTMDLSPTEAYWILKASLLK